MNYYMSNIVKQINSLYWLTKKLINIPDYSFSNQDYDSRFKKIQDIRAEFD
jgi:hypothetical protein